VNDSDGTVARVAFFDSDKRLGTITSPPFEVTLTNLPVGSHTVTAVAYDNFDATNHSGAVAFTIAPPGEGGLTVEVVGPPKLNRQTGLIEQSVRVRNTLALAVSAVRLTVRGYQCMSLFTTLQASPLGIPSFSIMLRCLPAVRRVPIGILCAGPPPNRPTRFKR